MPKHSFGWIRERWRDPRDVLYAVSPTTIAKRPPALNLRERWKSTPWDQGSLGRCGPMSAKAELMYDQEQTPNPDVLPCSLYVYYNTRLLMGTVNYDSGVSNRELCKALAQYGWCSEQAHTEDIRRFKEVPNQTAYAEGATRKVTRYERVTQSVEAMEGAIAQFDPFIFGFMWYASWDAPAVSRTGNLTVTKPSDRVLGGHDVVICGYDSAKQVFLFRNSWGNWGDAGYGTIPYAQALDPRKASDFWTLHWDEPAPPPGPVPPEPVPPQPPPQPGEYVRTITCRSASPIAIEVNPVISVRTGWVDTTGEG